MLTFFKEMHSATVGATHLERRLIFPVKPHSFFHCRFFAVPSFAAEITFLQRAAVNMNFAVFVGCGPEWFAYAFRVG